MVTFIIFVAFRSSSAIFPHNIAVAVVGVSICTIAEELIVGVVTVGLGATAVRTGQPIPNCVVGIANGLIPDSRILNPFLKQPVEIVIDILDQTSVVAFSYSLEVFRQRRRFEYKTIRGYPR